MYPDDDTPPCPDPWNDILPILLNEDDDGSESYTPFLRRRTCSA